MFSETSRQHSCSGKSVRPAKALKMAAASLVVLMASTAASAMPRIVETYGSDANPCIAAAPCETISAAIAQAGNNGRVIVGPGSYRESLYIDSRRIQITSRLGADQTVIEPPYENAAGVTIAADFVVFGQRDKGFTIKLSNRRDGLFGITDNSRIEGNVVIGDFSYENSGISLSGSRNSVRFNRVTSRGSYRSTGIKLTAPKLSNQQASGFHQLVQGNDVSNVAQCYAITSYATNHRNRIMDNTGNECFSGIRIDNLAQDDNLYATTTAGRITNNSIRLTSGYGIDYPYGVLTLGGTPIITKTRVDMTGGGYIGIGVFRSGAASVTNSSVVGGPSTGYNSTGMMFSGFGRTVISGNSIVGMSNGIQFSEFATSRSIRNNNIWGADTCALVLEQVLTDTQRFAGNFWGGANAAPDTSCDPETATSAANGSFRFSPASIKN